MYTSFRNKWGKITHTFFIYKTFLNILSEIDKKTYLC